MKELYLDDSTSVNKFVLLAINSYKIHTFKQMVKKNTSTNVCVELLFASSQFPIHKI